MSNLSPIPAYIKCGMVTTIYAHFSIGEIMDLQCLYVKYLQDKNYTLVVNSHTAFKK